LSPGWFDWSRMATPQYFSWKVANNRLTGVKAKSHSWPFELRLEKALKGTYLKTARASLPARPCIIDKITFITKVGRALVGVLKRQTCNRGEGQAASEAPHLKAGRPGRPIVGRSRRKLGGMRCGSMRAKGKAGAQERSIGQEGSRSCRESSQGRRTGGKVPSRPLVASAG
jgi:hypothetical protein